MSAYIPVAPDRWAELVQASAEVGPLRNKVSDLKTELELRQVEIDRLAAENERLRKAGDALERDLFQYWVLDTHGNLESFEDKPSVKAWLAAKGVQS